MSITLPRISAQWVYGAEVPHGCVQLDTPAWFAWLEAATTRGFSYPLYDRKVGYIVGFMTLRKERRQRGSWYWVAYRRRGGQVRKGYLGRSSTVTAARLQAMACRLHGKEVASSEQVGE